MGSPTRLLGLAVVVLLFLAMGCSPDEPPAEPPETPTATPEPTPSPDPAEQWNSCTSPDGCAIDCPADWATNEAPIDDVAPCSLFDPEPDQLRTEGLQLPADIAVTATVEAAPFRDVAAGDPHAEELDRRETRMPTGAGGGSQRGRAPAPPRGAAPAAVRHRPTAGGEPVRVAFGVRLRRLG